MLSPKQSQQNKVPSDGICNVLLHQRQVVVNQLLDDVHLAAIFFADDFSAFRVMLRPQLAPDHWVRWPWGRWPGRVATSIWETKIKEIRFGDPIEMIIMVNSW